jgi:hypothetical protein
LASPTAQSCIINLSLERVVRLIISQISFSLPLDRQSRMSRSTLWCKVYVLACSIIVTSAAKSMFAICDKNDDMRITKAELAVCMNMLPELETIESNTQTKVVQLMNLIDANNDGYISSSEFQKATERAQNAFDQEEYIDVTKADGSIQKVPKAELFNPMTGPGKGFEMKNEKIYKQEKKSGTVAELAEKDHALGNMIRIGQWTVAQLKDLNLTTGSLLKLESLPKGGSVVDKALLDKQPEALGVSFNGTFEVHPYSCTE